MAKVSIITPTYNHEKFIAECIKSVTDQTFADWEMIIIDDGSTDQTAGIAEKFAAADSRIRLIRQQNVGIFRLADTYNKALNISSGEYIAILEGDDYWAANKLEIQMEAFRKNPDAIVCWGQITKLSSDKKTSYGILPANDTADSRYFNNNPAGSILNVFFFRNCIPALTIVIQRSSLIQCGGFIQNYGLPLVDLPTLYRLALCGRFVFVPEVLGVWRIYPTQITKTYPAEMMEGFKKLSFENYQKIEHTSLLNAEISLSKIAGYYKQQFVISHSRSGRYKLIRKEYQSARIDYLQSIFKYGFIEPKWKIRSIIGLIFSYLHWDVELLAKWFGDGSLTN